jgi:hypothetical protein
LSQLACQDVIGSQATPSAGSSVVLDRVALTTDRILQINPAGADGTGWQFAKDGLLIRRGASFDLIVPDDWRGRLRIGWGSSAKASDRVRVPGCRPTGTIAQPHYLASDDWLAYAGGYWVSEAACVPLIVKAGQAERTVNIGVGTACPLKGPPPTYTH